MSSRSSPGYGVSTPPLKKYVTWAYFSVSATWNWRQPASENAWASDRACSGGKATCDRQPGLVLGHRHDEQVRRGRPARRATSGRSRRSPASARAWVSCARAVGPEVAVDDRVARRGRRPSTPSMTVGVDELVVLAAGVGRLDGRRRAGGPLPFPVDDRVVAALDALPALVAVHRAVAAADRGDPGVRVGARPVARSRSATNPSAERGGVSRPSSRAWTRTLGHAQRAPPARRARPGAGRWRGRRRGRSG